MPILSVTTMQQALLRLESIASQVSTALLALGPDDLDSAFERALRSLVDALDGRQATLLEHAEDASLFDIVSSWTRPGSVPDGMDDAGGSLTLEIAQHIDSDHVRILRVPEDLTPEAIDSLGSRLEQIGSAIGVPSGWRASGCARWWSRVVETSVSGITKSSAGFNCWPRSSPTRSIDAVRPGRFACGKRN